MCHEFAIWVLIYILHMHIVISLAENLYKSVRPHFCMFTKYTQMISANKITKWKNVLHPFCNQNIIIIIWPLFSMRGTITDIIMIKFSFWWWSIFTWINQLFTAKNISLNSTQRTRCGENTIRINLNNNQRTNEIIIIIIVRFFFGFASPLRLISYRTTLL